MNMMNMNANAKGNRYKTTMCKHFEQTGQCPLGQKCHFAHGKSELRSVNDPLPPGVQGINSAPKPVQAFSGPSNPSNNFRTAKCKFFDKGMCRFGDKCSFAHGDVDPKPMMNNDSNSNGFHNNMSSSSDKNVENEVAYQQIQFLASQMEDCHANDKELLNQIKQANELNKSGNVQDAASILYAIMSRPNKSKQDIDSYAMFVYKIQQYGNSLYQQLQSKQSHPEQGYSSMGYNPSGPNYGGTPTYNDGHGYNGQSGSFGMNNNFGASNGVGYTYDSYSGGFGGH